MGLDRKEQFLLEVQKLHWHLEQLTELYDMKGEVINIMVTGMLDHDSFGEPILKAIYSLNVENEDVLDETLDFIRFSYTYNESVSDEEEKSENWWSDLLNGNDSSENNFNLN
jgi:hypothetical protein|tara:strand:+ start:7835 stop:8170 length:336 start_codon:yes stop_codon:yes gene_type:complete